MKKTSRLTKILSYQSFGFLAIIALCWLNSLLGLPSLILEERWGVTDFKSPLLQMLLILAVWLLVSASTRRNLERLNYLEQFLHVCAWCHRIDAKSEWISMERFLEKGLCTTTSHGICPECLEKNAAALGQTKTTTVVGGNELPAV
jgi:hypothetical protein